MNDQARVYSPQTTIALAEFWGDPKKLLQEWQQFAEKLDHIKKREAALRLAAFEIFFLSPTEGTNRVELGSGYNLKAVHKINYKLADGDTVNAAIDQLTQAGPDGAFVADRLISWEPEMSVKEYKLLAPVYKAIVDTIVTTKPGMPTLEIEVPKSGE